MGWLGLLNICKLPGMSSHHVVSRVRKLADQQRVGHTGTLDPSACGVLPVCLGSATRLAEYISAGSKDYRAEILLGITTATDDAEGEIIARRDASHLTEEDIIAALATFTGTLRQKPPAHSAVWIDGRRAYDLAREGHEVKMPEREVTVHNISISRLTLGKHPRLLADLTVSKGTFIRGLARDLGERLGVGGTLSFLARTRVGECRLSEAITIEELAEAAAVGHFAEYLRPADGALPHIPPISLPLDAAGPYRHGSEIPLKGEPGLYRVYLEGRFCGLGRIEHALLRPVINL